MGNSYRVPILITVFLISSPALAIPAWEELSVEGPKPSPRRGVAGILDRENNRLVFQGGETASVRFLPDVWFFDLARNTWSLFSGPGPGSRCHHTFLVDGDRGRALLFGGFPRTNELWSWDITANTWTDITPPAGNPLPRCLHSSLVCTARGDMVVYGGLNGGFSPDLPDTWSYDLEDDSWDLVVAESPPGRRYGHVVALDEARDRMILFGGFWRPEDNSGLRNADDLWSFGLSTRTWTEITPSTPGPSPRQFSRGLTLPDGSGFILFGGLSDASVFMNDLWFLRFADLSWTLLEPEGPPPSPRFRHTLILNEEGSRLWVAFGEGSSRTHFDDIWSLDLRGFVSPSLPFKRGDANANDTVDLSDAITTLGVLFRSEGDLACEDAADSNDDGQVDISDAITILWHLFGTVEIPAPGEGACGADPTGDSLTCADYSACREAGT